MKRRPSIVDQDPFLKPFAPILAARAEHYVHLRNRVAPDGDLPRVASGHEFYGLHRTSTGWVFREWAPAATEIFLTGDFCDWHADDRYRLTRISPHGQWEVRINSDRIRHGHHYGLIMRWPGGEGARIPAYARRVVQDADTNIFSAQVWAPPAPYTWRFQAPARPDACLVYEAHVGMAQEDGRVGTYDEFRRHVLPRIAAAGYNTVQLMAIMEHPYYGSFGYHVSSFFAASSRFGTPEELKGLIDDAHALGLRVIIDLIHSHAVKNEVEGLSRFDGTSYQYFHEGWRGEHPAWDSRCFDYSKPDVLHFLLSNCRFWLDEYHVDGFRFDGITSMLYRDRGLGSGFRSYHDYFGGNVDGDALAYLGLANELIHTLRPDAVTVAEDVSGMPGITAVPADGGCGFDYRLAMGIPDCWFKVVHDVRDDDWNLHYLWHELTNKRPEERTIGYVESHDQAIVGSKTLIFHLADAEMYHLMRIGDESLAIDRAISLHKLIRLFTATTADAGYLNFMGNEFGHPEWIDFPREGNAWSYHYARRQWNLRDEPHLKYRFLADFDVTMTALLVNECALGASSPRLLHIDEEHKVIAFQRGQAYIVVNFDPTRSYTDYEIATLPGAYELLWHSDEPRFGGHDRLATSQVFVTDARIRRDEREHILRLYLPNRTALILRRTPPSPAVDMSV